MSAAAKTSSVATSGGLPSDAPASAETTSCSSAANLVTPSALAEFLSHASSVMSSASTPAPSALPVESLVAAVSSMKSIAMIAAQLVPLLATMDMRPFMQMLQVANPAFAATLSGYIAAQSAAAAGPAFSQITPQSAAANDPVAAAMQFLSPNVTDAGSMPQSETSVTVSSSSESTDVLPSASAVRCGSAMSCDSFQSSIYSSEASGPAVLNMSVPTDTSQSESQSTPKREASPDKQRSLFDLYRPSSTTSTSSSMYSTDRHLGLQDTAPPYGTVVYTCHLCSFRSSHKTRYAEHLSSEFSTSSILAMARHASDGASIMRRKRCSHCAFSTYLSEEFDDHVRIHSSSNIYRCCFCDYIGPSIGALKLHCRRKHRNKSYEIHKSEPWQKSKAEHDDESAAPWPQAVHLDPEVELYNVEALDLSDIAKLRSRHNVSEVNFCRSRAWSEYSCD